MKKTLWMLGAAVAALTSCTQNEVLDVPESKLIAFEPFVEKPTRADVSNADGADFREFYVYAVKGTKTQSNYAQDGELVLGEDEGQLVSGGKGSWTYNPHAVWLANHIYRFAAYANGNGNGDSSYAKLDNVTFVPGINAEKWGLDIADYAVGDRDLVIAVPNEINVTEITSAPSQVSLVFNHMLAKVIFQFYYTGGNGEKLEIEPFSFTASKTGDLQVRFESENTQAGTITLNTTWTPDVTVGSYSFFPKNGNNNQSMTSGSIQSEAYVIPQSNVSIIVPKITIHTKVNGDITNTKTFTDVSLNMDSYPTWRPGFVYRYVADISPISHQIHFTTQVTSFNDDQNRNESIE